MGRLRLGQPASTPAFASKLDAFLPVFWKDFYAQGPVPAAEHATATRWMVAMTAVGHEFEAWRNAAHRSDVKAFQAAGNRLSAHAGESATLSKQLGQTYCFQG